MSVVIPSLRAAVAVPGWAKNELWRNARAVPSLDLRFANNKSLVDAVTGQQLVTHTRASSGTFVDSAGVLQTASTDVPRFDHNPTTGESLGLLVEEARTNLLVRSEEFDDATWAKTASSVTANAVAAPNGTTTADTLIEDTSTGTHAILRSTTALISTIYTFSVYAKAASGVRSLRVFIPASIFGTNGTALFDIQAGTTGSITGAVASSNIVALANGWYRCSATTAASTAAVAGNFTIQLATGATVSYTGDGTSGIHLWGAQVEAGAFPTSYIATTGATATRSASLADLISSAIANNIRTLYLEFRSPASGTRGVVSLNDNTANERVNVLTSGTDPRLIVVDGGVEQANVNGGTVTANQRTRVAVRINANDFAISINGGAVVTDTSGTLPTVDRLMLGRTQAGEYLNGTLARVIGWDTAQPDLQSITQ